MAFYDPSNKPKLQKLLKAKVDGGARVVLMNPNVRVPNSGQVQECAQSRGGGGGTIRTSQSCQSPFPGGRRE